MRNYLFCILLFLFIRNNAQTWITSVSDGMGGEWIDSSSCGSPDYIITHDSVNKVMKVIVNHACSPSTFMVWPCGDSNRILLRNPYIEFRIKGDTKFTSDFTIATKKTKCKASFNYTDTGNWQIIFLDFDSIIKATPGMSDSIDNYFGMILPDGTWYFDYTMIGDTAVPPLPVIDQVKDKLVCDLAGIQNVTLKNVKIPGRLLDGLIISAATKKTGIIKDVHFLDLSGNDEKIFIEPSYNFAELQYTPVMGMFGQNDSIIVTLEDTIRHTQIKMAFKVDLCCCTLFFNKSEFLPDITVFPNSVSSNLTISINSPNVSSMKIEIFNNTGTLIINRQAESISENIDLSGFPGGIYIVKVTAGDKLVTRKIIIE